MTSGGRRMRSCLTENRQLKALVQKLEARVRELEQAL